MFLFNKMPNAGTDPVARNVIDGASDKQRIERASNSLRQAIKQKNWEMVSAYFRVALTVPAFQDEALRIAFDMDYVDVLDALLEAKANPNLIYNQNEEKLMATFEISLSSNFESRREVIDYLENLSGNSLLIEAVAQNKYKAVETLLKHGAFIDQTNFNGVTALMKACDQQNVQMIELLLKYKPNLTFAGVKRTYQYDSVEYSVGEDRNYEDFDAFSIVRSVGNLEAVKLLLDPGVQPKPIDALAALYQKNNELFIFLAEKTSFEGAEYTSKDQNFLNERLLAAVKDNDQKTVEMLIKAQADPNGHYYIQSGYSPLHCAVLNNNQVMVKLLVKHGANIHFQACNKPTALMVADQKGFTEIAEFLISKGATRPVVSTQAPVLPMRRNQVAPTEFEQTKKEKTSCFAAFLRK